MPICIYIFLFYHRDKIKEIICIGYFYQMLCSSDHKFSVFWPLCNIRFWKAQRVDIAPNIWPCFTWPQVKVGAHCFISFTSMSHALYVSSLIMSTNYKIAIQSDHCLVVFVFLISSVVILKCFIIIIQFIFP